MTFTETVHRIARVFESIRYHDQIPMATRWCERLICHRGKTSDLHYFKRVEQEDQLNYHLSACTAKILEHLKTGGRKGGERE